MLLREHRSAGGEVSGAEGRRRVWGNGAAVLGKVTVLGHGGRQGRRWQARMWDG